jgi:hypothetical protein
MLASLGCVASAQTFVNPFDDVYYGFSTGTPARDRSPVAARMTDLDGDGDLDAVVAQGNASSGFAVLLNLGEGYFASPVHYYTGSYAASDLVVDDFTGDGKPDVVVSNTGQDFSGSTVSLFPGTGTGTFGSKKNFTVGEGPMGVAAADFNGDGRPDLAVANNGGYGTGTTLSILYNNGIGGFNNAVTLPAGRNAPCRLATGFIDADTLPDLVVANEMQYVTVFLNTGKGFTDSSYQMQSTASSSDVYYNLQLADIDNDRDLDVLYSSMGVSQITLRRNNGDGTLAPAEALVSDFMYGGTPGFALADLNGDTFLDVVAATASGRTGDGYRIWLGRGDGTYGAPVLRSAGQYTRVALAADVDRDNDIDVLTVDNYALGLTVHLNGGKGEFPVPPRYTEGFPSISTRLEAGDVDNDGDLDVATSANGPTAVNVPVAVSLNNGDGSFAPAVIYSDKPGLGGVGVKMRDLNNDGFLDLLWASGIATTPYDYFTALNRGDGTFAAPRRWRVNSCGWNDIDAADLDNDGDLDVLITEWLGCPTVPTSGRRLFIAYNQGGGEFSTPVEKLGNPGVASIAICDFNEDGYLDVATAQTSMVDIWLNDRIGDLLPPLSVPMAQSPFDLLATDLDNDGHTDIASCNYGSNPGDYSLTIRLGNGDGTFKPVQLLPAVYSPDLANVSGIVAGDFDRDNDLDLMVGGGASNDLSIYLNDGKGVFAYAMRLGVDHGVRSPWFADFNGDGIGDLAALTSLPPSGLSSALTIVAGTKTGSMSGGAGLSACGSSETSPASVSGRTAGYSGEITLSPNPFSNTTQLSFTMPSAGNCSIAIYNMRGEVVQVPFNGPSHAGRQRITLEKRELPAGIYRLQLTLAGTVESIPLVVE